MADRARQSGCTTTAGRLQCDLWPHEDDPTSMHWDSGAGVWWQTEGEHIGHIAFTKGQWAAAGERESQDAARIADLEEQFARVAATDADKRAEAFLRVRGDGGSDG